LIVFFAGMKDEQGLWREYPSGRRVSFSHFPDFHELHGSEGIYIKDSQKMPLLTF
jgi:hypothetical protein